MRRHIGMSLKDDVNSSNFSNLDYRDSKLNFTLFLLDMLGSLIWNPMIEYMPELNSLIDSLKFALLIKPKKNKWIWKLEEESHTSFCFLFRTIKFQSIVGENTKAWYAPKTIIFFIREFWSYKWISSSALLAGTIVIALFAEFSCFKPAKYISSKWF